MEKQWTKVTVSLDAHLEKKLRERFADPTTGRMRYGAMSQLCNRLLLADQRMFEKANEKIKELIQDE